ncbi:MAG TPA: 1-phosphofructokinase family hexose kinase [Aggregatilinea sp.]|uniref:1-phosphofructokinase family hexose kinase n=1 Tax=Aggregatilinea sp. TaxID=2806333 RepID=UPI002B9E2837|nr:1-phosphofructokinase family hexose kinase [Aggregatilinea sp.]HML20622.1 1-phosphofructokinase family hexose kinase [Aggregatilinea sp.]
MILCVNPNAAIDKTVIVRSFQLDEIHRPEQVMAFPGGKGCNVARALKTLGDQPVVTGWVGGFAGGFIEAGLRREGIETAFVQTDFESRTCLSILDPDRNTLTEIYEKGEPVPPEQVEALKVRFREVVATCAAVTFSGSLPAGVPTDFYAQLIAIAREAGVLVLLDSSGDALRQGVAAKPDLIKPNKKEFSDLAQRPLTSLNDYAAAAADISAHYGAVVVLSMGPDGALAAKGRDVLHARPPQVDAKSAVGSGDCMLAGLAYGLTHGFTLGEAIRYGAAAGTANTLRLGAGNFALEDFERIRPTVEIVHY